MKRTLSLLLTLMMLIGILAIGTVPASAEEFDPYGVGNVRTALYYWPSNPGYYYLKQNMQGTFVVPKGTTYLNLNGYTITPFSDDDFAIINKNGGTLYILDSVGSGKIDLGGKCRGVRVQNGECYIYDADIVNGKGNRGGGVYVDKGAALHLERGATITNCTATEHGGGVFVCDGGTMTMNGGTITNCIASDRGGGICVGNGGKLTMTGGTITNCTAVYGAGIYAGETTTFEMTGGDIYQNTAKDSGGGVVINGGTFNMSGENSLIHHNTANDGGGIWCKGTVSISGTKLNDNIANKDGGAIFGKGGTLNISNCTLIYNQKCNNSSYGGGAIFLWDGTALTITGSTVTCNSSRRFGGGIGVGKNATLNMSGCVVNYNTGYKGGGGIYVCNTIGGVTLKDSQIIKNSVYYPPNNSADDIGEYGGGVLCTGDVKSEKITLGGNLLITDNDIDKTPSNLHFQNSSAKGLTITDPRDMMVGISLATGSRTNNGQGYISKQDANYHYYTKYFKADNTDLSIWFNSNGNCLQIAPKYTGSALSEGNIWIIAAVVVVAIGGAGTIVLVKKKKKPAVVNGAKTEDDE